MDRSWLLDQESPAICWSEPDSPPVWDHFKLVPRPLFRPCFAGKWSRRYAPPPKRLWRAGGCYAMIFRLRLIGE